MNLWYGKSLDDAFKCTKAAGIDDFAIAFTLYNNTQGKIKTSLGMLFYGHKKEMFDQKNYRDRVDELLNEANRYSFIYDNNKPTGIQK
jgi:hypothetical protein